MGVEAFAGLMPTTRLRGSTCNAVSMARARSTGWRFLVEVCVGLTAVSSRYYQGERRIRTIRGKVAGAESASLSWTRARVLANGPVLTGPEHNNLTQISPPRGATALSVT